MARRDKYEAQHARNRLEYERQVRRIFEETCRECGVSVTKIEALVKSAGEGAVLAEIPTVRRILDKLQRKLKDRLETAVINGIRAEWRLANEKYDALIGTMAAGDLLEKMDEEAKARTMSRNLEALEAFIKRKEAGLGLSQRVWHYTGQMREAMEAALELGIGEGQSAAEIARELKQYLIYPDKLFRRVRDKETGELKLSRPASLFHPGQGVYRSSYKNALRLALNETNIAYRKADSMRRKNLYFVVGIEVHLSNNHNCKGVPEGQFYDICDILQGKYPADFEFTGWHVSCRCWTSSILQTDEEFIRDSDGVYRGSVNEVKDVPPQFKQWVKDNADRIESAESRGSLPYFLRDNEWAWRGELEEKEPELTIQQRADIRHSQRTQAEIDAIKEAWNKRREEAEISDRMPEELKPGGAYLNGEKYVFSKKFFDLIDEKRPIKFEWVDKMRKRSNSYCTADGSLVHIDAKRRNLNSPWHKKSVIYHEYGHCIDAQRGLWLDKKLQDIRKSQISALEKKGNYFVYEKVWDNGWKDVRVEREMSMVAYTDQKLEDIYRRLFDLDDSTFEKFGIKKFDALEQILSTRDTIRSLIVKYGEGHSPEYFSHPRNKETEYLAHAFENAFLGNRIFKKYLPEIYDQMVSYIEELKPL